MSLRESLNRHPALGIGAVCVLLVSAVVVWACTAQWSLSSSRTYYSIDDGKTTFVDRSDRIAPFEHDGQQAVRAHVYSYDGDKTTFVAYLERYTASAKQDIESRLAQGNKRLSDRVLMQISMNGGQEVKKAGDPKTPWVNSREIAVAIKIIAVPPSPAGVAAQEINP